MIKDDRKVTTDYIQVGDILPDVIELADTPLLERD